MSNTEKNGSSPNKNIYLIFSVVLTGFFVYRDKGLVR